MPTLPADEDYARALLTLFRIAQIRARQCLDAGFARDEFLAHNLGRDSDFSAALDYAAAQGWITLEWDRIRLTTAGHSEA